MIYNDNDNMIMIPVSHKINNNRFSAIMTDIRITIMIVVIVAVVILMIPLNNLLIKFTCLKFYHRITFNITIKLIISSNTMINFKCVY